MVVIGTASEREEKVAHKCSTARKNPHTHLGFSPPWRAPFKDWRLPNSATFYTSKLREEEKLTAIAETYSDFSKYPEKSRRFGQTHKLFLLCEAQF